MKKHSILTWVAAVIWSGLCGPLLAEPAPRHITAKVAVDSSSNYKKISGSNEKLKEQSRKLSITLDNRDKEVVNDVTVKWIIYARTMTDNKVVAMGKGTEKTNIPALGTAQVASKKVTMKGNSKYTVTHVDRNGNNNARPRVTTKKHPAAGEEYYGYSVEVYVGGVLIDEIHSVPSLKNQ
jgi:hypothetical protein